MLSTSPSSPMTTAPTEKADSDGGHSRDSSTAQARNRLVRAAGAEQVAVQDHVLEPPHLGQGHGAAGTTGVRGDIEAGGGGVGHEERRDGQLQFIGQVAGEELSQDTRPAFDQETNHVPFRQIVKGGRRGTGDHLRR